MARRDAMPPMPPPGGDDFEVIEVGPPTYYSTPPTPKARGPLIPMGDGEGLPYRPAPGFARRVRSTVPLVPTADEVATLPRLARAAFAARCAERVAGRAATDGTPGQAARVLFETATTDTPLTAQLRCIRRDFARLRRLAREQNWTDDTPVPPGVFGPLWPPGVEPYWAAEFDPPPAPPPAG